MDKKILAKVSIGNYDVKDGDSGRFFIELDFADGEEPIIVTEEDPKAELEDPNDTLIDPWLSDVCYDVLLKSGLATEQAAKHCDPNGNGGFVARVFRINGDGKFTVYDDYSYKESDMANKEQAEETNDIPKCPFCGSDNVGYDNGSWICMDCWGEWPQEEYTED